MCTVTYIPLEQNNYLFTTSRDEHRDRPVATPPKIYLLGGVEVCFPKDPVAGGTWILSTPSLTLCILNGAFQPHKRTPPYRHSRGLIPLHFLDFKSTENFLNHYDFFNLEPFTLLVVSKNKIDEIRWDGKKAQHRVLSSGKPAIWASAPLYDSDMQKMRRKWFSTFLDEYPQPQVEDIFRFYTEFGNGDPHSGLIINRENGVQTGSICCVEKVRPKKEIHYWERGVDFD